MKRSELKQIVKDCLLEILSEAFSGNKQSYSLSNDVHRAARPAHDDALADRHRARVVESKSYLAAEKAREREAERLRRQQLVKEIAPNSVMADIFADTMTKTLPALDDAETKTPAALVGDMAARAAARAQPSEIGDPDVWTRLAFSNMPE